MNQKTPGETGRPQKDFLVNAVDHSIPELVLNIQEMLDADPPDGDKEKLRAALSALQPLRFLSPASGVGKPAAVSSHRQLIAFKPKITEREQEILILICRGFSNKEIASALDRSKRTVDVHRSNLFKKFGVSKVVPLIQKAQALMMVCNYSTQP